MVKLLMTDKDFATHIRHLLRILHNPDHPNAQDAADCLNSYYDVEGDDLSRIHLHRRNDTVDLQKCTDRRLLIAAAAVAGSMRKRDPDC